LQGDRFQRHLNISFPITSALLVRHPSLEQETCQPSQVCLDLPHVSEHASTGPTPFHDVS
jgi:hypothetical protein